MATTTFPPRPLACPRAIAGDDGHQGPEFADQTPVLLSGDPGFEINWGGTSTEPNTKGIVKVKSNGPANPGTVRIVLVRSTGGYPPGPGTTKTKVKGRLNFVPTGSFDCSHAAGNSNEIDTVTLANNGSFIVQTA